MERASFENWWVAGLALALLALVGCGDEPAMTDPGAEDAGSDPVEDAGSDPVEDAGPEDAGSDPAEDAGADAGGDEDAGPPDAGAPDPLDTFEDDVATAQCTSLFRCCDEMSLAEFFSQYRAIPGLPSPFDAYQDRLPPEGTVDETNCVALMRDLNDAAPFGAWLTEARADNVGFDEAAHAACLSDLETAACGQELKDALYDPQCFSHAGRDFGPTDPNQDVRSMFVRTAGVGESCVQLEDSSKDPYGTCDPSVAFCDGDAGTCAAVSELGEECSPGPDHVRCAPGLFCEPGAAIEDPYTCAMPNDTPLANGEDCMNASYESLGECTDGYCSNDTMQCEPYKADGESCFQSVECTSQSCVGPTFPPGARVCEPFAFCVGSGS